MVKLSLFVFLLIQPTIVIAASTLIRLWINFSSIDPIKALMYATVINGVIAVYILFAILRIANDKKSWEIGRTNAYPRSWAGQPL